MKINNLIIAFASLLLFASCENALDKKLEFEVTVEKVAYLTYTDTAIIAPVNSEINFLFEGTPDFIAFSYERFLPTNSILKFKTQNAWAAKPENTLQVYLSKDFKGLGLTDFTKDSVAVVNHAWTDITAFCNLPTTKNTKLSAEIPINEFKGNDLVIAFRYKPIDATDWQPLWAIYDLQIENSRITDGSNVSTYNAASMSFSPFDLLNRATAYSSKDSVGVWNTSKADEMQIKQTVRNRPMNEDWLISKPILIPYGLTEFSEVTGVKNTTLTKESFSYTFNKVGVYTVRFKASNYNYLYQSSVEKTVKIVITD